ncbi:hypothetical protein [Proteus mirabilis]|uniref:hypothetical protein n=1 Tax=Proteus mirabilis TaxID=584 RepID=UPI00162889C2|nr:hypothetical protein [Proteus mirabilis]MBB6725616.1 hypothetical protein [Proteus mirabilis]
MLEIRAENVLLEKHSRSGSIRGAGESTFRAKALHQVDEGAALQKLVLPNKPVGL